jgi:hypothetical protein
MANSPTGAEFVCPAGLALSIIARNVHQLERKGTPDPETARALLRLARRVEIDTGEASGAVPWLIGYLTDCAIVEA